MGILLKSGLWVATIFSMVTIGIVGTGLILGVSVLALWYMERL